MKNNAPLQEPISNGFTPEWARWFTQVYLGLIGWTQSFTAVVTIDFPLVAANSESTGVVATVTGARLPVTGTIRLASVEVTPSTNTVGITYKALVTGRDQITVYAINYTVAGIDPPSMTYRIIVKQ